ncbi:hypothetical protein ACIBCA_01345 [Kitasatospora sp. NPDC051170]|uniref:hypothetical protein n=1 Tax=Kitasatospora sp. NPDC051170 TaxID=3364056 RepID=UPI0037917582
MAGIDGALKDAMAIDGVLGAALVDSTSGMALGTLGEAAGLDLQHPHGLRPPGTGRHTTTARPGHGADGAFLDGHRNHLRTGRIELLAPAGR